MIVILPPLESAMALEDPLSASPGPLHINVLGSFEPSEVLIACPRNYGLYRDVEPAEAQLGEEYHNLHMINIL